MIYRTSMQMNFSRFFIIWSKQRRTISGYLINAPQKYMNKRHDY